MKHPHRPHNWPGTATLPAGNFDWVKGSIHRRYPWGSEGQGRAQLRRHIGRNPNPLHHRGAARTCHRLCWGWTTTANPRIRAGGRPEHAPPPPTGAEGGPQSRTSRRRGATNIPPGLRLTNNPRRWEDVERKKGRGGSWVRYGHVAWRVAGK